MSTTICMIHGVPEEDRPGDYGSCLECAHIWRTEADWRANCEGLAGDLGVPVSYELTACPLCAHDLFNPPWLDAGRDGSWDLLLCAIGGEIDRLTPDTGGAYEWRNDFVFSTTRQDILGAVEDGINAYIAAQREAQ